MPKSSCAVIPACRTRSTKMSWRSAGSYFRKSNRKRIEASMQLHGFHHLTAVTGDVSANLNFYTQTLGMRLVKKTVNQDDVTAYHLFYADGNATPGTDITFFDWPLPRERRGTRSIVRTGLRVASLDTLKYWRERLNTTNDIIDRDGRPTLDIEHPEGQRLSLVADDGRIDP